MFLALLERLLKLQQPSQVIPASELTDIIRKGIKIPQVRLYTRRSPGVDFDTVNVGGLYDSYSDREGEPCVELALIYHPDQQHIDLAKLNWGQVCFDVAECVGHEFVHRDQYRRKKKVRKYKSQDTDAEKREEQEYLGASDEIEAYGFTIAAELAEVHDCFELDHSKLNEVLMYRVYSSTFDTDQSVVLKLHKQISKYLRRLEIEYDKTNSRARTRPGRN
jgi:hypothetical protein